VAIFITGKYLPGFILRILCITTAQGNLFSAKQDLSCHGGIAVIFYTRYTGRLGAKPFYNPTGKIYYI
jgi:hypothetical protein